MTMTREERLDPDKAFHPFDIIGLYAAIWLLEQESGDFESVKGVLRRTAYKLDLLLDPSKEDMKQASDIWLGKK